MKTFLKFVGVIVFAYLAYDCLLYISHHHTTESRQEKRSIQQAASNESQAPRLGKKEQSYRPTGKEINLLRVLLKDDLAGYAEGRKSSKTLRATYPTVVFVTADTLQMEYQQNEVAADRKYRNNNLFISGVVASIDRGIGENYYLQLMGGSNMFLHPHANMADGLTDYLAGLEKGQHVNLFCKGDGLLIGSAIVTQCIPTSIWVEKETNDYIKGIGNRIEAGDKGALSISVIATALQSILPESSSCYSSASEMDKQCSAELEKGLGSKKFNEAVLVSVKKYGKDALFISEALQKKVTDSQQEPVATNTEPAQTPASP